MLITVLNFRKMNKIYYIILALTLVACTKEISLDIDSHESKIVVNSFFSPQEPLYVNISKSTPIISADTLNYISNAEVELFSQNSLIGRFTYDRQGFYNLAIKPEAKREYYISVSVPGFKSTTSHDIIPSLVPIIAFDTISLNEKYLYCEITFKDITDELNYYLLDVTSKYPVVGKNPVLSKQVDITIIDNIVENGSIGDTRRHIYFSDKFIQGSTYELSFLLDKETLNSVPNTLYLNFKSISKNYYTYVDTYYKSQTKQLDIYTNIDGGYGIFAGYDLSQDSIIIQ